MLRNDKALVAVLVFNAVSAGIGGLGLIFGAINLPGEWLNHTPFGSYLIPGLILLCIVGGSAACATFAAIRRESRYKELVGFSGLIMMLWIIVEILLIRQLSLLQGLYFVTGSYVFAVAAAGYKSHRGRYV